MKIRSSQQRHNNFNSLPFLDLCNLLSSWVCGQIRKISLKLIQLSIFQKIQESSRLACIKCPLNVRNCLQAGNQIMHSGSKPFTLLGIHQNALMYFAHIPKGTYIHGEITAYFLILIVLGWGLVISERKNGCP